MISYRSRTLRLQFAVAAAFAAPLALLRAEEEKKPETIVAVAVAKVVRTTLHAYVTGYGTVETALAGGANHGAGGARLAAAASGLVLQVAGVEGARVEQGAILVQLEARAADAAVARAQAMLTSAEKARARQAQLHAADGTSERAMQEAEERFAGARGELAAAQLQQSQLAIRAPIAGTIARLTVKPGEWLDAGKEVGEIVDLDRLVVAVQVPAGEAAGLQVGQAAAVFDRIGSDEKPLATGALHFVSPLVVPATDTVLVRLALPKASGVRPGKFVAVRIVTEERAGRLAVPHESVCTDSEGHRTVSIVEGEVARQKAVQVGLRDGDLVEVSGEGISEGATVVTVGSYALPKETRVRLLAPAKEGAK
jgi:membrane fusion protein (multidrug efflux system)